MTRQSGTRPLVSVVVPVYNGAPYLRESLDSILAQTYTPLEVIAMDDASTDATQEILASYENRVRCYRNSTNLGQFENVNAGIALARGAFIAVYHADDIYDPQIVEREVVCFEQWPDVGAVFSLPVFVDADGVEYARLDLTPEMRGSRPCDFPTVFNALLRHENVFLACPGAMVRAAAYRRVGLYRQEPWRDSADLEMWIRLAREFPIVVLEEYLMKYRHFPHQAHRRYNRLRTEPALYFAMMDGFLSSGGREIATADALAAHEGHRAEDRLMTVVNSYIRRDLGGALAALSEVKLRSLVGTPRIQRGRMVVLWILLHVLARLPRVALVAALFEWRWQSGRSIGKKPWFAAMRDLLERWQHERMVERPHP
jgi:glycosyltransferase involved in cell wall biosynthesis